MAFKISPSVDVTETDLTLGIAAIATSIAGFTGAFQWGPVQEITTVTSEQELVARFGKPNNDIAAGWLCAANFLAYSNNMKVARVAGASAKNAVSDYVSYNRDITGTTISLNFDTTSYVGADFTVLLNGNEVESDPSPTPAAGKYYVAVGNPTVFTFGTALVAEDTTVIKINPISSSVVVFNQEDYNIKFDSSVLPAGFVAKYPGSLGNGIVIQAANATNYADWENKNAFDGSPAPNSDEFHLLVIDGSGAWTGTPNTILEKFAYVNGDPAAKNTDGSTAYYVDVINRGSKYIWVGNTTAFNFVEDVNYTPAYKADATGNTITFSDIGMEDKVLSASVVKRTEKYTDAVGGDTGFTLVTTAPQLTGATVVLESSVNGALTEGVDYSIAGNVVTLDASYNTATGQLLLGETITTTITNLSVALTLATSYVRGNVVTFTTSVSGTAANNTSYIESADVSAPLSNIYSVYLGGGVDDNVGVDLIDGYTLFQDAENVDIQLMIAGAATQDEAKYAIDNIGEGRKDCVVFVSPTKETCVNIGNPSTILDNLISFYELFSSNSYAFADGNYKYQYDKYNDVYRWVPLCGDIAGLAARTDQTNDPWWAFSGYNRGNIKNVTKLAWNPKKAYRDDLFRNRINAVVTEAGEGAVLLGDKTMLSRPSAFDAVNVRRLFITIEKAIATSSKFLLFEFNDQFTQAQFRNLVEPFLRDVKGRRGIEDFRVVCDDSNNTGEVKQRREFVGDIYIKPNYAIRYVQLNFIAVRSDVSFNEVGA